MIRYVSPVNPAVYPHLATVLLSIGLFFMAWFFVYPFCVTFGKTFVYYMCTPNNAHGVAYNISCTPIFVLSLKIVKLLL